MKEPQLEMLRGTEWRHPLMQKPPVGGNFEPSG